jgi:hypothetical protein
VNGIPAGPFGLTLLVTAVTLLAVMAMTFAVARSHWPPTWLKSRWRGRWRAGHSLPASR